MDTSNRPGGFFLIGGKSNTCYATFVELAGGPDAHIVIIPHASGIPVEAAADVVEAFARLGATNVAVLKSPSRFAVKVATALWKLGAKRLSRLVSGARIPDGTNAVYISGGDQGRLVEKLGPGGIEALEAFHAAGGLIAGTSAGAACMGNYMIDGGMKDGVIRANSLLTAKGLGLTKRIAFDTHMWRDRYNRPIVALAILDIDAVFGLDEDTGVYIKDGIAVVYGVANVWYYRRCADFNVDFSAGSAHGVDVIVRTAGGVFTI